jgi:hypothetical protein
MRRILTIAASLAAAGSMAGGLHAQQMDLMQYADADGDGKVTLDEYKAFTQQGWTFFSQGADKVKVADLDPMAKGAFAGITPDAQGYVSQQAYLGSAPARFKAADKNNDGVLSAAELNASIQPAG